MTVRLHSYHHGPRPRQVRLQGLRRPKLRDNKLKAAKTRLRNAGCKIGKVKKLGGATAKTGKVTKQNPKPRTTRVPGTKVNVTLKP
jgi:beta-lactam-binding protein with PASTA domain